MNFFNNLAGAIAPFLAGYIAAVILVFGILCFLLLLGRSEQIHVPGETTDYTGPRTDEPSLLHRRSASSW